MRRRIIVLAPSKPPTGGITASIAALLAKADHRVIAAPDGRALYGDLFELAPDGWPAAALTRQFDAGDAGDRAWLRADPAHFRAERANVRMLACGDVGQSRDDNRDLLAALAPLFGDEGFELSATQPARWYLRPFAGNAVPDLPDLPPPDVALGADLFELWPEDGIHRRWRRIFSEAQILLADHPVNRSRSERSLPAINGLWFWGAGRLPTSVRSSLAGIVSHDPLLCALARWAGLQVMGFEHGIGEDAAATLLDLRDVRPVEPALRELLAAWNAGGVHELEWRSPQGRWLRKRRHRWRFWR